MDMQGTPLGSSDTGMKNTSDPERYTNPSTEGAGAVASDSLAADSARSGGGFGENRDSQPLSTSGSSSTFNNTDTSGATTLAPAPDAAEREAKAAWSETADEAKGPGGQKYPEGAGGQPKFPGQHSMNGYAGGPTDTKGETAGQALRGPSGPTSSMGGNDEETLESNPKSAPTENTFRGEEGSNVDAAPGYVGSVVSEANQTGKPKGKNLEEVSDFGENEGNNPNFEIGDENDPGRKAQQDMQRMTQSSSGSTAPRQKMGESDNSQYDVLETDQNL
ncbi:hypothetical protein P7C71_g3827, partial [Lecanoromycetidae sp. Uapishka_2]